MLLRLLPPVSAPCHEQPKGEAGVQAFGLHPRGCFIEPPSCMQKNAIKAAALRACERRRSAGHGSIEAPPSRAWPRGRAAPSRETIDRSPQGKGSSFAQ